MPSTQWESILITTLVVCQVAIGVVAQQGSFQWGFNDWTSTTLPQCQPLAIFVNENIGTVKPVPPYYLAAFEANGLSTVNYVGNKAGNLSWTVNHLTGAQLVLTMFDSVGNSGGVLFDTYTIAGEKTGANASCISTSPPVITVKSNVTSSQIKTCDTVQLSISGGNQPYSVSIAETNAQAPTNVSVGTNNDIYSWVNNLSPGNNVILSVFDSNGHYGVSTGILTLSGSPDTHCPTSSTSSSNSTNSNKGGNNDNNQNGNGNGKSSTNTPAIAGAVIGVFFAGFFGLLAWFFARKQKQKQRGIRESRRGWSIDRSDSVKVNGGRARLPSEPHESEVAPFRVPTGSLSSPSASVNGYADAQATPFILDSAERPTSSLPGSGRGTIYRDRMESEVDEEEAYALDAFRMSGVGSNSGSAPGSVRRESVLSRGLRVVNEDGADRGTLRETKRSMAQTSALQQERAVFQHQDAGIAPVEEIPPAYPGPSGL